MYDYIQVTMLYHCVNVFVYFSWSDLSYMSYQFILHFHVSSSLSTCRTCAQDFGKHDEMYAAALAYKCTEVAYLRSLYCKSYMADKDRSDLQANLQMLPQGIMKIQTMVCLTYVYLLHKNTSFCGVFLNSLCYSWWKFNRLNSILARFLKLKLYEGFQCNGKICVVYVTYCFSCFPDWIIFFFF